jgi:hypothetical protein
MTRQDRLKKAQQIKSIRDRINSHLLNVAMPYSALKELREAQKAIIKTIEVLESFY